MPTYDYGCVTCATVFETVHGMLEEPEVLCPQCGGVARKRISAGARMIFKGSGFYVTDYGGAGGSKSSGAGDSGCGSGESCGMGACATED